MASGDKLVYFDVWARGEPTRMLYALAGKPLKDERVTFEQWPSQKEGKLTWIYLYFEFWYK